MSQLRAIVDKLLTNVSSAYIPKGFICENLLPYIGVKQTTGKLAKYGTNYLRLENSQKKGRGKYREVEPIVRSSTTYEIEGHGLEGMVTKEDYLNVESPYDAEKDETMGISMLLWVEKELLLATALASTATITQNVTLVGGQQYSDKLSSTPIQDFETARASVRAGCGVPPNVAFMSWEVWNVLRFHPQLLDSLGFKFNRTGGLTNDEMAVAMGVEKIIVASAMYDNSKEGQASVLAPIWGKNIWFAVIPDSAQPYQVSMGYRLGYQGEQPRKVFKTNNFNPPGSTKILCEDNYDQLLSNILAVYLIKNAVA